MNKILTIIIPTYNMEKYLRRCLDSLIIDEEGMKQLEVLVINDGSKDSSSQIAHEYQDKYPDTFRIIDKENGNYGSCINRGMKEATGKYVKVLDADDWFDTENFRLYFSDLSKVDVDLVVNDFVIVNEKNEVTKTFKYGLPKGIISFDERVRSSFNNNNFQMHAVTYRLQMLKDMGYKQTEGISYTDQEWIYTPLMQVSTLYYCDKNVYIYLVGREGQTMSGENRKKGVVQNQRCVLRIMRDFANVSSVENPCIKSYLADQAIISLRTVYSAYLLKYDDISVKDLEDFDSELRAINPDFIRMADNIVIPCTCYHFIKYWHTAHKKPSSPSFKFNRVFSKIVLKLQRIIKG